MLLGSFGNSLQHNGTIENIGSVPESATVALSGLSLVGLVGIGFARKKKKKEKIEENVKKKSA